jgi:hypothetical protein
LEFALKLFFGGGMAGINLLDTKRLKVSTVSPQKDKAAVVEGGSMEAEMKQFPQETCIVQSDASMCCMGEADRLADNNEIKKIMATAAENSSFIANVKTPGNKL